MAVAELTKCKFLDAAKPPTCPERMHAVELAAPVALAAVGLGRHRASISAAGSSARCTVVDLRLDDRITIFHIVRLNGFFM
jgi:hypothetical protein